MKLLVALNLISAVYLVSADFFSIPSPPLYYNSNDVSMGVLVGEKTPVFLLTGQYYDVTTKKITNVFHNSSSLSYYQNPSNSLAIAGTLYPKLLIVVDNAMYKQHGESGIYNAILNYWNEVDSYFHKLDNPKMKLSISGVIVVKDESAFEFTRPTTTDYDSTPKVRDALTHLRLWVDDHRDAIDHITFDMVFLMSSHDLDAPRNVFGSFQPAGDGYYDRIPFPGLVAKSNGVGGCVYAVRQLSYLFGVQKDTYSYCYKRYVLCGTADVYTYPPVGPWSRKSKSQFASNYENNKYLYIEAKPDLLN